MEAKVYRAKSSYAKVVRGDVKPSEEYSGGR